MTGQSRIMEHYTSDGVVSFELERIMNKERTWVL